MQCQVCNQNEATVHSTEIEGPEKRVIHLCQECAQKRYMTLPALASGPRCCLVTQFGLETTKPLRIVCPYCGTASDVDPEFRCPECGATGRRDAHLESRRKKVCLVMERGSAPKRKAQE